MKLRHFVTGSSVILAGWLVATFIHEVPSQRYPKLDKYPATSAVTEENATAEVAATAVEPEEMQVSASR